MTGLVLSDRFQTRFSFSCWDLNYWCILMSLKKKEIWMLAAL